MQKVIGIPLLIFTPLVYGLFLLVPFGIWQVMSSLVTVFIFKDRKRKPHLLITALWLTVWLAFSGLSHLGFDMGAVNFELGFLHLIIIPACIGLWYFMITRAEYKDLIKLEELEAESEYV